MHPLANALIVVDVQNDFCPGGSLAVEDGDLVASRIHQFIMNHNDEYKVIVATKDWHPVGAPRHDEDDSFPYGEGFPHFSATPNFVDTWPIHCVRNTNGAKFHPNLHAVENDLDEPAAVGIDIPWDRVFYKGQATAAYSGFEGTTGDGFEQTLDEFLKERGIGHTDVVGIETVNCVNATAVDSNKLGYDTTVLTGLIASLVPDNDPEQFQKWIDAGIHVDGWVA